MTLDYTTLLKGLKTIAVGAVTAAVPAVLQYVFSIDPVTVFGLTPAAGAVIGVVMSVLHAAPSPLKA